MFNLCIVVYHVWNENIKCFCLPTLTYWLRLRLTLDASGIIIMLPETVYATVQ